MRQISLLGKRKNSSFHDGEGPIGMFFSRFFHQKICPGSQEAGDKDSKFRNSTSYTNWIFLFKISLGLLTWVISYWLCFNLGPAGAGTPPDKTNQPNVTPKKKWWHFPQDGSLFAIRELLQEGGPPSCKVVLKKQQSLFNHGCKWV